VICPARTRRGITCSTCQLCTRTRDVIVGLPTLTGKDNGIYGERSNVHQTTSTPASDLSPPEQSYTPETPYAEKSIRDLPLPELKAFHEKVGAILAERTAQAREDFRQDFLKKLDLFGMSIDDFKQQAKKKEVKKRNFPIKYRDPDNPANVWTGIGKPKKWLQEKLDQGHSLEEFLIAGAPAEPAPLS
jgi:DNA-binding protein H-NS